jgi:hypothetical protein
MQKPALTCLLTHPLSLLQVMLTSGLTAADRAALLNGAHDKAGDHLSRLLKFVVARAGGHLLGACCFNHRKATKFLHKHAHGATNQQDKVADKPPLPPLLCANRNGDKIKPLTNPSPHSCADRNGDKSGIFCLGGRCDPAIDGDPATK